MVRGYQGEFNPDQMMACLKHYALYGGSEAGRDYVPATGNKWLLTDVLRQQWKFGGFVVTDYGAINEMMNHGMAFLTPHSNIAI